LLHSLAGGYDGVFITSVFNGALPGTITRHKVGDVEGMVAAVMAHCSTPGANVYTGLHLMRSDLPRGRRGTRNDIVCVLGLVVDMDADTGKFGAMPVEPSYTMQTSPGNSQPVILFDRPLEPIKAEVLAKAIRKATQSDFGTGDVTHVWRIAGTLNFPNAAKVARGRHIEPAEVTFIQAFEGLVYDEAGLLEVLAPFLSEEPALTRGETFTGNVETGPLWDRLGEAAREALLADGEPDRSVHVARLVERLQFEGFGLDEIVSLCQERTGPWATRYVNDAGLVRDIERLWNKFEARRKANAEAVEHFLLANDHAVLRDPMPTPPVHDATPFLLDRPGGLISDIAQWVFLTSPSPIAEFSIMSAVVLLAGLFGRRWLTPDGLGLNLYVAHVAGSGFGKDRPLKALAQIAESLGRGYVIGPNDVASDSALEFILRQSPCQVLPLDELGMLLSASGRSSDAHARARRKAIWDYIRLRRHPGSRKFAPPMG
jgi:hypothetical protein